MSTIVGFPHNVEDTYLGEQGVLTVDGPCQIVVDMITSQPSLEKQIIDEAAVKGIASLDAPVSDIGARNGILAIMWG